jgi:hypothetical protein
MRPRRESNPLIAVLRTAAFPFGYVATSEMQLEKRNPSAGDGEESFRAASIARRNANTHRSNERGTDNSMTAERPLHRIIRFLSGRVKYRPDRPSELSGSRFTNGAAGLIAIALTARNSHVKVRFEMELDRYFHVSCRCCARVVFLRLSLG